MAKKPLPKQVVESRPDPTMPDTPGDRLYFHAKKTVLDHEVREFTRKRDFRAVESTMKDYGLFLERHPEADSTS